MRHGKSTYGALSGGYRASQVTSHSESSWCTSTAVACVFLTHSSRPLPIRFDRQMRSIGPHVRKGPAESRDDANQTAENVEADLDRDTNSWSRRPVAPVPTETAAMRRPSPIPEEPKTAQPFEGPESPPQHQPTDIEPSVSRSDSTVSVIEPSFSRSDITVSVHGPSVSSSDITVSVQAPPDSRSDRTVSVHGPPVAGCGCAPFSCVAVGETKESDQHERES